MPILLASGHYFFFKHQNGTRGSSDFPPVKMLSLLSGNHSSCLSKFNIAEFKGFVKFEGYTKT